MLKGSFEVFPAWRKFLFTLGIAILSSIIFSLLALVITYFVFDINAISDSTALINLSDSNVMSALKLLQALGAGLGLFIVPAFLCAYLFSNSIRTYLRFEKINSSIVVLTVVLLSCTSLPLINYLIELNSHLTLPSFLHSLEEWMKESEAEAARLTDAFVKTSSLKGLLINLFVIALLPAVGEELMFRGVGQKIFTDWTKNHHAGIWISAIVFSSIHMQFFGFLPRLMLGVYFGYMMVWTNNIWFPILAHFINNACAVLFAFLITRNSMTFNPDEIGTNEGETSIVVLSLALTCGLLYHLYKTGRGR